MAAEGKDLDGCGRGLREGRCGRMGMGGPTKTGGWLFRRGTAPSSLTLTRAWLIARAGALRRRRAAGFCRRPVGKVRWSSRLCRRRRRRRRRWAHLSAVYGDAVARGRGGGHCGRDRRRSRRGHDYRGSGLQGEIAADSPAHSAPIDTDTPGLANTCAVAQ